MNIQGSWDKACGLSSLSEKTRESNHLQMSLQRQHFLLSYLKTLHEFPECWSCQSFWSRNQLSHLVGDQMLKAWPNSRNISTQHLATLLGTMLGNIVGQHCWAHCCNIVGHNMLHTFGHPVAICCNMLDEAGSNLKTVKCCMMLYSFGHVHATLLR